MEIPDQLTDALNDQVTLELASSIAYLQFAAHFETADLPGMASWMRLQAEEEHRHADRFMSHLTDRNAEVRIGAIPSPADQMIDLVSPLSVFRAALSHEQEVSSAVRDLYRLAVELGDIDVLPLLQWFVAEQLEEEASVSEIIAHLERAADDSSALLLIDRQLGARPPETRA